MLTSLLSPTGLAALITAVGTLVTALQLTGRRRDREKRVLSARLDDMVERFYAQRTRARAHNDAHHPTGDGAYELIDLPDWLASTDDKDQ